VTALLPRIVKKELSTQSALAIWCSWSSDTTHYPIFVRLTCEFLRLIVTSARTLSCSGGQFGGGLRVASGVQGSLVAGVPGVAHWR